MTDSATPPELAGGADAEWIGRVLLGRYRVVEAIGSGGMGTAWRAEDLRLPGKSVVVKAPHAALLADGGFRCGIDARCRA